MSKARNGSQYTRHMATPTVYLRLTPVRSVIWYCVCPHVADMYLLAGFNQIDLPQYSSYEMLRQQLLLAINEGGEGFGFA